MVKRNPKYKKLSVALPQCALIIYAELLLD